MSTFDDAFDDHRARPAQGETPEVAAADDRDHAQAEAVQPAVSSDAADATPQDWSTGSEPASGPGVATEPPFWREETTHVEAPLYRGGAVMEPAQNAALDASPANASGLGYDASPANASGLGYDAPGYDAPGYDAAASSGAGYGDQPSLGVPARDPWATGPVTSTPRADAPTFDAPPTLAFGDEPRGAFPWSGAGDPSAPLQNQTSTYGAWQEPRTGPSYTLGAPYGPAPTGENAYAYGGTGSGLPQTPPENASKPKRWRTAILGTAVVAALIGGATGAGTVAFTDNSRSSAASSTLSTTGSTANTSAVTNGTVSAAAKKITPSVVTIQVVGSSESGTGSGVIVRSDGYILTNNHVVSVAGTGGSITVQTSDGRSAKATIVGTDPTDDLAVIKVTGLTNLTAATFAKSSALTVGQTVVAVGAPLDLPDTVTSGIVSATARTVRSGDNNEAVFAAVQTDAAINPGNSGGALVDLNGNVIGINAAIASTSSSGVTVPGQPTTQSGSIGIGFAIPSDEASRIANELITTGKATHAVLGVEVESSSSTTSTGAILHSVTAGGSAASAGLKAGDVVTAVNGSRISDGDDLIAAIRSHAVKDSVTITYTRGGTSHTVKVTLRSAES